MKRILGLDLGTNSIGWALVEIDHKIGTVKIIGLGSRILPMDSGEINDFESKGKIKSNAAQRTEKRGIRRLNERFLLRRDRLHLVLNLLDALPNHYKVEIDFERNGEKCGQFKKDKEPKLAYKQNSLNPKKYDFLFQESYQEMLNDFGIKNEKGKRIPYDWTLYFLRQKALKSKISLEELAWVLLSYNQKRGYEKTEVLDQSVKENELVEELDLEVKKVLPNTDKEGKQFFEVHLDGNDTFTYKEYSDLQLTFVGDLKEIRKTSKVDDSGSIEKNKVDFTVVDIYPLAINKVAYEKNDGKHKYTLTYQNGWQEIKQPKNYTFRYKNALNKAFDYIVETVYDHNGEIKTQRGKDRSLREPDLSDSSSDWTLLKKKTEKEALAFNLKNGFINPQTKEPKKYISTKIYNVLQKDAVSESRVRTKIIGGKFQVVDRAFYREELNQIIKTQKEFHTSLEDKRVFEQCVNTLYPKNANHAKALLANKNAIQHLMVEDILLYQRPLKSKKSEIANCKYEIRYWKDVLDKESKKPIEVTNKDTGEISIKKQPVYHKVASASHPYFQEFRIWDKLHNLKLIQYEKLDEETGEILTNVNITDKIFKSPKDYQDLYNELNNRKSLNQEQFLKYCKDNFKIPYNKKESNYSWNFPEDEELKGNETRVSFATRFKRYGFADYSEFLTQEKERDLWHYLYSVNYKERKANNNKSATTFFNRFLEGCNISNDSKEKVIKDFVNYPKFASKYCGYSEKALKKLIPLIRIAESSRFYAWESEEWYKKLQISLQDRKKEIIERLRKIDFNKDKVDYSDVIDIKSRIPFPKGLFNAFKKFENIGDFVNLNLTQASYLVYGRHSELAQAKYWKSPDDIRTQLHQELKQNSLNNPVAEKVILEMMQIVADLWEHKNFGNSRPNYFSKIHLEVGRELKKSAKEKENLNKNINLNRNQNKRIRQVLEEYLGNATYSANPKNIDHFERLKIIEVGAEHSKNTDKDFFNNEALKKAGVTKKSIEDILKKPKISKTDFEKYKLWIEQGYKSPYTNRIIKLTDLFDGNKYNIDHVFPQAAITNNSLNNKVVCEREVNKLKSNQTGREFVNRPTKRKIFCTAYNSEVEIVGDETYVNTVKALFSGTKRYILLSNEIPKGFTSSQLNNARHIAKKAMELLSHIVREEGEIEFRSKNVVPVTGRITSELKKAWKLNEVWSELVSPRFIRMNELTESKRFGDWQTSKSGHEYFDCNLDKSIREKDESYNIKRIDHRHHALDALIVALCTEEHVNYINNINSNAKSDNYGRQKQIEQYRRKLKRKIMYSAPKKDNTRGNDWYYMSPGAIRLIDSENSSKDSVLKTQYLYSNKNFDENWKGMTLESLNDTVTTFKQNLRIINKTVNRYNNTPDRNKFVKQKGKEAGNSTNWSIRRSLGKETYYGRVNLKLKEKKKLYSSLDKIFKDVSTIVDQEMKERIEDIKTRNDLKFFKKLVKDHFPNTDIELYYFSDESKNDKKIASREPLVFTKKNKFNREKISKITDTGIQKILVNQLKQFDTTTLPFVEGIQYFDALLEKDEFAAIIADTETEFETKDAFINYLKSNGFKYQKTDYSILNVFVNKVSSRDFRNEEDFNDKMEEHPEIAFSPEAIEEMNKPSNLFILNEEKNHAPIRKVRVSKGFGNQRALNEKNEESVKSKQFVVNDAGSNLYLGVYELADKSLEGKKVNNRIFKGIGLMDLIAFQKSNGLHPPFEEKLFKDEIEYQYLFSLSPDDIVVLKHDGKEHYFAFNNFTDSKVYFRPVNHAKEIEKTEVDLRVDSKKNKLIGSQENKTEYFEGLRIRDYCLKLKVDRLGNFTNM